MTYFLKGDSSKPKFKLPTELKDLESLVGTLESLARINKKFTEERVLVYWSQCNMPSAHLKTVDRVFDRLNFAFENGSITHDWDILWSCEYLGKKVITAMNDFKLKQHQKINHIPGMNFIIKKWLLGINTDSKYLLPTFVFPEHIKKFKKFIKSNENAKFIDKSRNTANIHVVTKNNIDINSKNKKFYQIFLEKPFLIDGHAFDFGVFVLITSVNPLRVYRYRQEVLLRFASKKYHPFDINDKQKYVVANDYKSSFEMPSFEGLHNDYEYSSMQIFERIVKQNHFEVREFWKKIDKAIVDIVLQNEHFFIKKIKSEGYEETQNFFELLRFDMILDEDLNPFVIDIDTSQNLSPESEIYESVGFIYEQLIYNTINLISGGNYDDFYMRFSNDPISVSKKNLATNLDKCLGMNCRSNCEETLCSVCAPCLSIDNYFQMRESYREHIRRGEFKRIFPYSHHLYDNECFENLTENNKIMAKWFASKCEDDESWC